MILKDSMNVLVIVGCSVWCRLLGCMFFGFRLGSTITDLCMSKSIYVSKFWSGACRKFVRCVWL